MKLILMTAMMLSLGLLTACGGSGGSDSGSGDPDPSTGGPTEGPNETGDLDSLPLTIVESVNEYTLVALNISEYKATNSYVFTGIDADKVKLITETGEVVFNSSPLFDDQASYNFIMVVTSASQQTKDIDVTINIVDIVSDLDSLNPIITVDANENHRFAFTIPEYKDTNSYAFTGVDGDKVKLWAERGEVIFNYAPDFETKSIYDFVMTVTNEMGQTKNIAVTINVQDITTDFILEILDGTSGRLYLVLNDGTQEHKFDTYSFTVTKNEEQPEFYQSPGNNTYISVGLKSIDNALVETQRFTIRPFVSGGMPSIRFQRGPEDGPVYIRIVQWGDNPWTSLEDAFGELCKKESVVISFADIFDAPNLSNVQHVNEFLSRCNLYNNISYWDVSKVKNMDDMFRQSQGSTDLSQWDVSSAISMFNMFGFALEFNSDLSKWNTSSVEDMAYMFGRAKAFNSDLLQWDVSSVKDMEGMFDTALAFNNDISLWDTASVENMSYMFYEAESFGQNLSGWNVDSVTFHEDFKTGSILMDEDLPCFDNTCPDPTPAP